VSGLPKASRCGESRKEENDLAKAGAVKNGGEDVFKSKHGQEGG